MNKQIFLTDDEFATIPTPDLIEFADNGLLLERAKALYFLAQRCGENKKIIPQIVNKIFDRKNKKATLLGTVTVSFLGIKGLLEVNTSQRKKIIDDFIKTLSRDEYENLIDFLKEFN